MDARTYADIKRESESAVIFKTHSTQDVGDGLVYVMSDETVDRLGDVIVAKGWDLRWFRQNPIALFGHMGSFPVGHWEDVRIDNTRLVGRMVLAEAGTSPRIDELRNLVRQKILRTVSVGFKPLEREYIKVKDKEGFERIAGIKFLRQELLECSLVSIPANPNALQVAKSLSTSQETMSLVFGELADMTETQFREFAGKPAEIRTSSTKQDSTTMSTLAQRIQAKEARREELRTRLAALADKIGGDTVDEAVETDAAQTTAEITAIDKQLEGMRATEKALGQSSSTALTVRPNGQARTEQREQRTGSEMSIVDRIPWAAPKAKVDKPGDYFVRAAAVKLLAHVCKQTPAEILRDRYGEGDAATLVRMTFDFVTRAATAPADTTTSGWASQLVNTIVADFIDTLMPMSIYPGLSARGLRLTFGRNGIVSIPGRSATPTIAGSFVAQGAPIPVRQGAFTAQTLGPKKLGVISTFTREIAEHSTPSIEELIRQAMQEDTAVAVDTVLLDNNAATSIRPAGIRNGVSTITPSAATLAFDKLVADLKGLVAALITGTSGNLRAPVWLMNPVNALSITLTQNAGGDFPFRDEVRQNTLIGFPLLQSSNVPANMVILIDAADFASVTGDEPRFDVSDQAVLHMEDTTPLAISSSGTPNTVAAPVRSLWQTDTIGIRMLLDMNWTLRRTGIIAWVSPVGW